ncbi:hypothetical protein OG563_29700 [Nocardia vinacea]|uniref:DUF1918 domain-containing protein n=1 Tax=Nocardia vinacea TaxID=96468 RepID=A0ABZ1YM70_9NOCA|nr:hypothetical protein [Nocardia vinacea]
MVNIGDRVLLAAGGVSQFEVLELDGNRAVVESVDKTAPGCYPFSTEAALLVPIDPD